MASGINNCIGKEYVFLKTNELIVGNKVEQFICKQKELSLNDINPIKIIGKLNKNLNEDCLVTIAKFRKKLSNEEISFVRIQTSNLNQNSCWPKSTLKDHIKRYIKSSNKEKIFIKPSNLIRNQIWYSKQELQEEIENSINSLILDGKLSDELKILNNIFIDNDNNKNNWYEIPLKEGIIVAIRDYFGEILAPIAFCNLQKIENYKLYFNTSINHQLFDSQIKLDNGDIINFSSKGGTGSSSSLNALLSLSKDNENEYVKVIKNNNIKESPLILGEKYKILNTKQRIKIIDLINQGTEFNNFNSYYEFEHIILNRKPRDKTAAKAGYFLLSCVAKEVSKKLNEDKEIKELMIKTLIEQNFIQSYLNIETRKNKFKIKPIKFICFNQNIKDVSIEADKCYYSTRPPQGGFGFKIII